MKGDHRRGVSDAGGALGGAGPIRPCCGAWKNPGGAGPEQGVSRTPAVAEKTPDPGLGRLWSEQEIYCPAPPLFLPGYLEHSKRKGYFYESLYGVGRR